MKIVIYLGFVILNLGFTNMLIGIDASRANRDHKSGTEWYSYYLIRWLSKFDAKNQYILYTDKPLKGGLLNLASKDGIHGKKQEDDEIEFDKNGYQKIKSSHKNFKGKILKWPFNFLWTQGGLSLEMLFRKPDVLFVPAHALPIIHPKNSIVTIHDVGFERYHRLYDREQIGPEAKNGRKLINFFVQLLTFGKFSANSADYLRWSTMFALKNAKKIITVSDYSKKEIMEIYGKFAGMPPLEEKIKVIHNGYNKNIYQDNKLGGKTDEVLDKYGIEKPYLLYVGRLEKKKNTPALIEAFAIMRDANKNIKHKLVLVGDANFGYDDVKYMVEEYLLEDDVIMPGWIEEEDMPFVYCGSDGFIFPSLYEGFGVPLLQAMSCGSPITASRAASIPEVVGGAALLFDPQNVEEIADSMAKIIRDKALRDNLIRQGKERVKNFSWEKCARETFEAIENVVRP
mgnify:CR=1 FL=1